jgi:hypothetical protein
LSIRVGLAAPAWGFWQANRRRFAKEDFSSASALRLIAERRLAQRVANVSYFDSRPLAISPQIEITANAGFTQSLESFGRIR